MLKLAWSSSIWSYLAAIGSWLRSLRDPDTAALQLLRENLSTDQCQQYDNHRYFDVIGGTSGKRYRVRHGRQMNVDELDNTGRLVRGLCFLPEGWLSTGDILLVQKFALELMEANALSGARPSSVPGTELRAWECARGSRSNPSFV